MSKRPPLSASFKFLLLCTNLLLPLICQAEKPLASDKKTSTLPLEQFSTFAQAFHQVRKHYVTDISDEQLMDYAIQGMLENLDPHSTYLNEKDHQNLKENTSGEFAGIGVEVSLDQGLLRVISPIADSPAEKAGILAGDSIIDIDGFKVKQNNLEQAVEKMRGPIGSKVKLVVARGEKLKQYKYSLRREKIKLQSVQGRFLEPGFAYVRISQFRNNTATDLKAQLEKFAHSKQTRGLILDLRNNPGGALSAAIEVADFFMAEGLVVYTQGRDKQVRQDYSSHADTLLKQSKIVVLINAGSASASEILAGALQDRNRAVIVGTRSFGKGSVQTVLPLPSGKGMKLTTARYFTPNGRSIQAEGIQPDIYIPNGELEVFDESNQLIETDLSGHLGKNTQVLSIQSEDQALSKDYQLQQALNLLKAMQFSAQLESKAVHSH